MNEVPRGSREPGIQSRGRAGAEQEGPGSFHGDRWEGERLGGRWRGKPRELPRGFDFLYEEEARSTSQRWGARLGRGGLKRWTRFEIAGVKDLRGR